MYQFYLKEVREEDTEEALPGVAGEASAAEGDLVGEEEVSAVAGLREDGDKISIRYSLLLFRFYVWKLCVKRQNAYY